MYRQHHHSENLIRSVKTVDRIVNSMFLESIFFVPNSCILNSTTFQPKLSVLSEISVINDHSIINCQIRNEKSVRLVNRVELLVYAPWTYLGLPFCENRKPTAYSSCYVESVTHSKSKNILEFISCQQINGRKYVKRFFHTPPVHPYKQISFD